MHQHQTSQFLGIVATLKTTKYKPAQCPFLFTRFVRPSFPPISSCSNWPCQSFIFVFVLVLALVLPIRHHRIRSRIGSKRREGCSCCWLLSSVSQSSLPKNRAGGIREKRTYCLWLCKSNLLVLTNNHRTWGSQRQSWSTQAAVAVNQRQHAPLDNTPSAPERVHSV